MAESSARAKKRPKRARNKKATVGDLVAALDPDGVVADPDAEAEAEPPPPTDEAAPESGDDEAEGREVPEEVELSDTLPMAPEDDLSDVEGEASDRLVSVLESLLFAADRPLTVKDIRRLLKDPSIRQIQLALKELMAQTVERGVVLGQVAGGFRLRTHPRNAKYVQRMLAGRPTRLSRSQLEALAVIAYRQPITKAEIDHVRGVDCSAVLRVLLERDLARIVGRKEEPGRPILYGTTVAFLEFFNLRSLRDMPDLHEFRELTDDSRATLRERYGDDAEEIEAEVLGQQRLGLDDDEDADADDLPRADDDETEVSADDDQTPSDDRDAVEDPPGDDDPPEAETAGDDEGSNEADEAADHRSDDE